MWRMIKWKSEVFSLPPACPFLDVLSSSVRLKTATHFWKFFALIPFACEKKVVFPLSHTFLLLPRFQGSALLTQTILCPFLSLSRLPSTTRIFCPFLEACCQLQYSQVISGKNLNEKMRAQRQAPCDERKKKKRKIKKENILKSRSFLKNLPAAVLSSFLFLLSKWSPQIHGLCLIAEMSEWNFSWTVK